MTSTGLERDREVPARQDATCPATAAVVDEIHRACRAASMMARVAQQALREDPRFSAVWMRAGERPGEIDIGGRVADRGLLALLHRFADDWGGIRVAVQVDAPSSAAANEAPPIRRAG